VLLLCVCLFSACLRLLTEVEYAGNQQEQLTIVAKTLFRHAHCSSADIDFFRC